MKVRFPFVSGVSMLANVNKIEVVVDASRAPPPAPVKALSERIAYVHLQQEHLRGSPS